MKILAMSDLHGYLPNVGENKYDLMIIAGDVVPLELQTNTYLSYCWLTQEFQVWCDNIDVEKVVLVPGNHDFVFEQIKNWYKIGDKINVLINRKIVFQGKTIFGCPYTTMDTWAFKREKYRTYKKMIPTDVDILVTHQPPLYNGLGMVEYDNGDIKECGSPKLMERIIDINPELVICGHIHTGNHSDVRLGNIRLYNVSLLDEQYRVRYEPKLIYL